MMRACVIMIRPCYGNVFKKGYTIKVIHHSDTLLGNICLNMFGIWNVGVCVGRIYTSHHPNPNYTVCAVFYTCIITYGLTLLGLQCTHWKKTTLRGSNLVIICQTPQNITLYIFIKYAYKISHRTEHIG